MTELRPMTADEMGPGLKFLGTVFGQDMHDDDIAVETPVMNPPHTLGVFEDGRHVATAAWFDHQTTVPGGTTPVAGVTWVSVAPTHRRRGVLTSMMRRQLDDLHSDQRPVAALWTSEATIYQRFGYGPASWCYDVDVPTRSSFGVPAELAGLRLVEPSGDVLAPIFDRCLQTRVGWFSRSREWWTLRLHDPEHDRNGASSLRCVVDGEDGYALYATKSEWGPEGPRGTVNVRELVAATPAAEVRLWRYLLDLDLMGKVQARLVPVDTPLVQLLLEPRVAKARLDDALWVRLVSVEAGLATRTYATEVDVVLDVTDSFCPWNNGRLRLSGGPDGATCTATTDAADLSLDVRELGAAFLGGTSLCTRATAGRVEEHTRGALAAAAHAFGWPGRAAHCPMVF